ncbi:MAG: UDP-N-acetylenolpyruvoylglucosamine reductase [Ruminococcus sp.]|nr:UDP-N-acetylenolpyruvoylglucosamine reductase [Ruminococcus sp.]
MNTRETAYSIFEQLSEEQLKGFIAMFQSFYPVKEDGQARRDEAFNRLESMRRHIPQLDETKELNEYREEKYS